MNTRTKAGRTKRDRAVKQLTPDQLFFYDHAGYSHNPKTETAEQGRIRCAKSLAFAERTAERLGWRCEWEFDQDPDLSWMSEEDQAKEHEVLVCRLLDADDRVLEAVGGVTDPDRNYGRVVEAELADEALAHLNAMRVSAFVEPITE